MKTTLARRRLIDDAKAKGYTVTESDGCCRIHTGKTQRSVGLQIWPDGTATRSDIDLSMTTTIRTIKAMRTILSL